MAAAAAQKILGRLGSLGVGLAVAGGVAQSALYNGSIFVSLLMAIFAFQWMVGSVQLSSTDSLA